jgi:hypothetical protein
MFQFVLEIHNNSRGALEIAVDSADGPPFDINGFSYKIFDAAGNWRFLASHHPDVPFEVLSIGPGDTTEIKVWLYGVKATDSSTLVRVELAGTSTDYFHPCVAP